ncbi:hypothetical protein BZA70DRAFT_252658 [Myxozyma melibiosi]|uniref:Flavin-containing monooxygenase n=1 Tax=Myxozyma melibiosi TaxID=54550 RepID=A0ABR1FB21_9ASCO
MSEPTKIKRVAVIGAGASGLAAAKALVEEQAFDEIKIFERNAVAGGLWNYNDFTDKEITVPSLDTEAQFAPAKDGEGKVVGWPTAAYDSLTTNVPGEIMMYLNPAFKREGTLFLFRQHVADFLQTFADQEGIQSLIRYNTNVVDVRKVDGEWIITYVDAGSSIEQKEKFDAVVVASGYFNVPFIPKVKGLEEYSKNFPGRVTHAKAFRKPDEYIGKTVLVVGNAASGTDIANQLVLVTGKQIYKSVRSESTAPGEPDSRIAEIGEVVEYKPDGSIVVADGQVLTDIDAVIYATGYLRTLPFLSEINKSDHPLITDGAFVHSLYLHFIYTQDPTLALLGTLRFVLPFRVSQAQACYIARVWSGRLGLPPKAIMEHYVWKRFQEVGNSSSFHDWMYPLDADFCEWVYALCKLVDPEEKKGYFPRRWPASERTIRKGAGKLKTAFTKCLVDKDRLAVDLDELRREGYFEGELEADEDEPDFSKFGKVVAGPEGYTEEEVLEAVAEMSKSG